jgi:hypothetical protein
LSSTDDFDIQLELKERINYTEIMEISMRNEKEIIKSDSFSISKLHLMIVDHLTDIPFTWYDKKFRDDIQNCITKQTIPNRRKRAGVYLSDAYHKRHNIPLTREKINVDYFKLKMACRNLLDRLNMLIRKDKIEKATGVLLNMESLDDLIDSEDDEDEV